MKRRVSEVQESLWSKDTVALARGLEANPKRAELGGRHWFVFTNPQRRYGQVLARCAVALAFTAAAIAIFDGSNGDQRIAHQTASSRPRREVQQAGPRASGARAPQVAQRRRRRRRHRVERHPKHGAALAPDAEPVATVPPAGPTEVSSEVSAEPPISPPPPPGEIVASAPPTSASTEFGIEHSRGKGRH